MPHPASIRRRPLPAGTKSRKPRAFGPEYPLEAAFESRNYTSKFVITAKIKGKNRVYIQDGLSQTTWGSWGMISASQGTGNLPSLTNVRHPASACYNAITVNPNCHGWFRNQEKSALVEAGEESSDPSKANSGNGLRANSRSQAQRPSGGSPPKPYLCEARQSRKKSDIGTIPV